MTSGQMQWVNTMREAALKKPTPRPRPPDNPLRAVAYHLMTWPAFDVAIMRASSIVEYSKYSKVQ